MKHMTLETCMDILDWFDDETYEYISHILLSKIDGRARVARVLPELRKRAQWLVSIHEGTEGAYPAKLLNRTA